MDACCFIDAVKQEVGSLPTDRTADAWHIKKLLEAHKAGDVEVITSTLSVAECVAVEASQVEVPQNVQEHFRRLITSGQFVNLAPQTPKTARIVQDLRWTHKIVLRGADALHLATAIEREAVEFLTTDDKLKSAKMSAALPQIIAAGVRMIRAADTIRLPDYMRQGDLGVQ